MAIGLIPIWSSAQNISSKKWKDLFSYNNVLKIVEDNGTLVAATENGIFFYHRSSGEINKISKANGLHNVDITAFDYNPVTNVGLIGYRDGSLDVIKKDEITFVVDIPIAQGFNGDKKINHIYIDGDRAVISVNYGVSIFDLKKKEFAQSAFFNNGGNFTAAHESVIQNNIVFTATDFGLRNHEINVTFPVFDQWGTTLTGNFNQIDAKNGVFIAGNQNQVFFGSINAGFFLFPLAYQSVRDVAFTSDGFLITEEDKVHAYTSNGLAAGTYELEEKLNTAISVGGKMYAGTVVSGIIDADKRKIKPDGPFSNRSYKMELIGDKIWVSSGSRKDRYNGAQPDARNLGFYFFNGNQWSYASYFSQEDTPRMNVLDAVPNPTNLNEVFFTNYSEATGQGIYKMKYQDGNKDFTLEKYYETTYAGVFVNRPVGCTFDTRNQLFCTVAFMSRDGNTAHAGLLAYDKASDSFLPQSFLISQAAQKPLAYDEKLWVPLPRTNHLMVYDHRNTPTNFSDDQKTIIAEQNGLPTNSNGVLAIAIDKNEDAWIGTNSGLRVLRDAAEAVKHTSPTVENIVITQNNIAEELFRDSEINQIAVDEGNHKWISIEGGGVYYLSADGERVVKHFTKENSPLPTNSVTDIKIDTQTGTVYFVTFNGIVAYQGDVGEVNSGFGKVLVYPNPVVTANFSGKVTIRGLAQKTNLHITDAAGNVVHSAVARGGYYEWDLNNMRGRRVASGVYFVLMTNEDGTDKATAKIAVIN